MAEPHPRIDRRSGSRGLRVGRCGRFGCARLVGGGDRELGLDLIARPQEAAAQRQADAGALDQLRHQLVEAAVALAARHLVEVAESVAPGEVEVADDGERPVGVGERGLRQRRDERRLAALRQRDQQR